MQQGRLRKYNIKPEKSMKYEIANLIGVQKSSEL